MVEVSRKYETASLSIDGSADMLTSSPSGSDQLNIGEVGVYLGGIEDSEMFSQFGGSEMSLKGCIHSLEVTTTTIIKKALTFINIKCS